MAGCGVKEKYLKVLVGYTLSSVVAQQPQFNIYWKQNLQCCVVYFLLLWLKRLVSISFLR